MTDKELTLWRCSIHQCVNDASQSRVLCYSIAHYIAEIVTDWSLYFLHPSYSTPGFYSPPWAIPVLRVLAKFPSWLILVLAILTVVIVSIKKLSPIGTLAFLTCPFTVYGIGLMNIDWLLFVAMLLPPAIACYLYSFKPHIGWLAMLRTRRYGLFILALLLTIRQWGVWLTALRTATPEQSLFPFSMLLIPLVWHEPLAVGALLSPHLSYSGYMFVAFAIARRWAGWLLGINAILWGILLILEGF